MAETSNWHFETEQYKITGANDPIHETFRAKPFYSIVRESIQNSMDAVLNENEPVKVKFETVTINQRDFPRLFKLKDHIESCLEMHKGDRQAEQLYGRMMEYLDSNQKITMLKIADFNTEGMEYDPEDINSDFISFVRGEGKSTKTAGSGGSFGFGKGAYYVLSKVRTLIVSTMTDNDQVYFEGKTRLASHRINGTQYGKDGFYNKDGKDPIDDAVHIPLIFRRSERGTDIYILGLTEDENSGEQMIRSVLNNFWYAVHQNLLNVEIDTKKLQEFISKDNLDRIMNDYYHDDKENGSVNDIVNWNPKPYYKAVKHAGEADHFMLFEESLPILKNVKLYIYRNEGLKNRTAYLRKPAMVVQKKTDNMISGYVAVFVCSNDDGNDILRNMENSAHNEWKIEHNRDDDPEMIKKITDAYWEFNNFIRDTLSSLSSLNDSSRIAITGLTDYLSIPEDLMEKEEIIDGSQDSLAHGAESNEKSEGETGLLTTEQKNKIKIKPIVIKPGDAEVKKKSQLDPEGEDEYLGGGGTNEGEGGDQTGDSGEVPESGKQSENGEVRKTVIPIKYRVAATMEEGEIYHHLIINAREDHANSSLELKVGSDNGNEVNLQIMEANTGNLYEGNLISNVVLKAGNNNLKVKFNDGIKHSIKILAYES